MTKPKTKEYYVEVYRTHCPYKGVHYRVHNGWPGDALSPDLTALIRVGSCTSKDHAVAIALERLAGHGTDVDVVLGNKQRSPHVTFPPVCVTCGKPMERQTVDARGKRSVVTFWACKHPECSKGERFRCHWCGMERQGKKVGTMQGGHPVCKACMDEIDGTEEVYLLD